MLQEAIAAARQGDRVRARDLLTRLLRIDRDEPDHWLWMSAVVDSRQEKIFCLENLLRVQPNSLAAQRGLVLLGARPAGEVKPVPPLRRQAWEVAEVNLERPSGLQAIFANPVLRLLVFLGAAVIVAGGITLAATGFRPPRTPVPTPDFLATAAGIAHLTLTPSITPTPTVTSIVRTNTPTPINPTPLEFLLESTYTPTPLYVNTPHTETEAYRLGILALGRKDWESVAGFMEQALATIPESADLYYYLGEARRQLGENSAALAAYNQAIQLDGNFGPAYLGRALTRLAIDPETDVTFDFLNAERHSPDHAQIYIERALYLIERGRTTEAEDDLQVAQGLLPESPLVPYLRALILYQDGDLSVGLVEAQKAYDRDLTFLPVYLLLGRLHLELGGYVEAVALLQTYLLYEREDLEASILLGQAQIGAGYFDLALGLYNQLIEAIPDNPDLYFSRGLAYLAMEQAQPALDDLNQANRLRRDNFEINLALGRALLLVPDPGDAYVQFNNTLALAEGSRQEGLVYYYRGLALYALSSNDENTRLAAIRDFELVVTLAEFLPPEFVANAQALLAELQAAAPG